jgi:lysozyme
MTVAARSAPSKGPAIAAAAVLIAAAALTIPSEGVATKPYWDPAHIRTYCIGETKHVVERTYGRPECEALLEHRLATDYAPPLERCVPQVVNERRVKIFAAFLDAAYNAGVAAVCKSRMARALRAGGELGHVCRLFDGWYATALNRRTGQRIQLRGLEIRRRKEMALCLEGAAHDDAPPDHLCSAAHPRPGAWPPPPAARGGDRQHGGYNRKSSPSPTGGMMFAWLASSKLARFPPALARLLGRAVGHAKARLGGDPAQGEAADLAIALVAAFFIHQHIARNAIKAADKAGYDRAKAEDVAATKKLAVRARAIETAGATITTKAEVHHEKAVADIARDAGAMRLRWTPRIELGRGTGPSLPGVPDAAGGGDGTAQGALPELVEVPRLGLIDHGELCDVDRAKLETLQQWLRDEAALQQNKGGK